MNVTPKGLKLIIAFKKTLYAFTRLTLKKTTKESWYFQLSLPFVKFYPCIFSTTIIFTEEASPCFTLKHRLQAINTHPKASLQPKSGKLS